MTLHLPDARSGSGTTRNGSARSWPTWWATRSSSRRGARVTVDRVRRDARWRPDRGRRHRRRDRPGRAAAYLRALLSRLAGERGARQRQRPGPRDRALDRGHARRHGRGREPGRERIALRRDAAPGPPPGRGHAGRRAGRGGTGRSRTVASSRSTLRPVERGRATLPNVQETSPSERPQVNPEPAPYESQTTRAAHRPDHQEEPQTMHDDPRYPRATRPRPADRAPFPSTRAPSRSTRAVRQSRPPETGRLMLLPPAAPGPGRRRHRGGPHEVFDQPVTTRHPNRAPEGRAPSGQPPRQSPPSAGTSLRRRPSRSCPPR